MEIVSALFNIQVIDTFYFGNFINCEVSLRGAELNNPLGAVT